LAANTSTSNVLFKPFPKQEEFIAAVFSGDNSLVCYGGAMGGGKSVVCLATLILLCKVYPGSKWCVIRESIPTLKKTTLETFKRFVPKRFIKHHNQQDHVYTFTNDSQIMFMAEDYANDKDFDRFKGLEVNGFLLEQIEELQEGLLAVCFIRAGRHKIDKMPKPIIMCNVNPTLLWPKTRIYDKFLKNELPKGWAYISAKITDNPVLADDKDYMNNVTSNLDDLTKARLIDGDWSAFGVDKPFLYSFGYAKHVRKGQYVPNPHLNIIISFDFNKDPMTCSIGQALDVRTLVVFDALMLPNSSTPELCDQILAKYATFKYKMDVTGDSTGVNRSPLLEGDINHYIIIRKKLGLKDHNLKVQSKNRDLGASRILCNSILQHAEITIMENCNVLINDVTYAQADNEGGIVKSRDNGRHMFDNFRYMLEATFPDFITKPHLYIKK
jgi:hypothetical protein